MDSEREEVLTGGNMDAVVRVGGTVRRASGAWTPSVRHLLDRYAEVGISETPRALGMDERDREVLSYLPGEAMVALTPHKLWSPSLLREAGALLRRMHDASASLLAGGDGAEQVWRQPIRHPIEVVCHNDFAPYNLIVRDGALAGVIDFDMASPGPRIGDLAYLAYRLCPFAEDASGFDPVRDGTPENRLGDLIAAYGHPFAPADVLLSAAERLDGLAAFTDGRAAETGRDDFLAHAAMYRRDAVRLRSR